jgi:hypothetical protein
MNSVPPAVIAVLIIIGINSGGNPGVCIYIDSRLRGNDKGVENVKMIYPCQSLKCIRGRGSKMTEEIDTYWQTVTLKTRGGVVGRRRKG